MEKQGKTISAAEGMTLRRRGDGMNVGRRRTLGMVYYAADGSPLEQPYLEHAEDYEEIPDEAYIRARELAEAKNKAMDAVHRHDTTTGPGAVNNFYFVYAGQHVPYWFSAVERTTLSAEVAEWGKTHDTYRIDDRRDGVSFDISCKKLLGFLSELKEYAVMCFNKTSDHLAAIAALQTVEEVESYDYTEGYPENKEFII